MTIKIGVIGCGVMGADHARILLGGIPGGRLVAVHDSDPRRAAEVAAPSSGVRAVASALDLIVDRDVDAVLIASPNETHAALTIACIEAGKPVLCEKPLASTLEGCRAVVAAEMRGGRRLVQVGFMRRFDPGYCAMKRSLDEQRLGRPLFLHCVHRNAVAPPYITSQEVIASSAVHEMDIARFLLGEELAAVTVISGRASRHAEARQPQFLVLESASGVLVTVEAFVDARYGYDVQAELVCEDGAMSLAPNPPVSSRRANRDGFDIEEDWRARFADAYREQMRQWVASIETGRPVGSSAWDGYAASAIAGIALKAQAERSRMPISLGERPAFYGA
jgi:myo-inositol 2-dehydrogenase / D-chiro-inositol 1-dehydrogenase